MIAEETCKTLFIMIQVYDRLSLPKPKYENALTTLLTNQFEATINIEFDTWYKMNILLYHQVFAQKSIQVFFLNRCNKKLKNKKTKFSNSIIVNLLNKVDLWMPHLHAVIKKFVFRTTDKSSQLSDELIHKFRYLLDLFT